MSTRRTRTGAALLSTAAATLGVLAGGTPSTAASHAPSSGTAASAGLSANVRFVVSRNSGKCLTVHGAGHGNNVAVDQYRCVGAKNQQWRMEMSGGDTAYANVVLRNINSGKCLTVHGASPRQGAKLDQYTCVGAPNQTFTFKPALLRRTPLYTQPLSGNKCVDVQGGSKADNAPVIQWKCKRVKNQEWDLTRRP
ncbi:RICIN domain-containing protein [Streptomyces sparsogenes]|uniref:RICIN domain-containing protein n=1 Tax=Streptomyces sparsogenes TaxID=67365 RepID=UPI0033FBB9B4